MTFEPGVKVPDIQEPLPTYSSPCLYPYFHLPAVPGPIWCYGYCFLRSLAAAVDDDDHATGAQYAKMKTAAGQGPQALRQVLGVDSQVM
jgi:hypothetical protein